MSLQLKSFGRYGRWLGEQRDRVRELLGLRNPQNERDMANSRRARERFWDALHEGEREAEARCSRRDP